MYTCIANVNDSSQSHQNSGAIQHIRRLCIPGSFFPAYAKQPGDEAMVHVVRIQRSNYIDMVELLKDNIEANKTHPNLTKGLCYQTYTVFTQGEHGTARHSSIWPGMALARVYTDQ